MGVSLAPLGCAVVLNTMFYIILCVMYIVKVSVSLAPLARTDIFIYYYLILEKIEYICCEDGRVTRAPRPWVAQISV